MREQTTATAERAADEPYALPAGWRWVRIGDVCRVVGGSTPDSGSPTYWSGDIVWVTPTDLGKLSQMYVIDSTRHITAEGYSSCGTELVPPGTVILSSRAPIGHIAIAGVSLCTNQGCKSFVPGPDIDSPYLYFALKRFVRAIQSMGSGATFSEVSKTQLGSFEIPLPPLDEQRRIAAALAEQMAAVERARAAAEAQLAAARALPAAYLRAVFESDEAQGWPRVPFGRVARFQNGRAFPSVEYVGSGVRLLRPGNLFPDGGVKWPEGSARYLPERWAKANPDLIVLGSELIMNLTAQSLKDEFLGRICITDENEYCLLNQRLARISPTQEMLPRWALYALKSPYFRRYVDGLNTGSLIQHMFTTQLETFLMPLPPLSEQRRIVARLEEQMAEGRRLREALEAELAAINALPAALLRRAFRGEL